MWARVRVTPPVSGTVTFDIRAKIGDTVVASKTDAEFSPSTPATELVFTDIVSTTPLETRVGKKTPTFTWEVAKNGGNWVGAGDSGPHTMYWTWASPLAPPFYDQAMVRPYPPVYDQALEKACGKVESNTLLDTTQIHGICLAVMKGVADDIYYNPNADILGHPMDAYDSPSGSHCACNANLLRGLLRTIGIPADLLFLYGGLTSGTLELYNYRQQLPSLRLSPLPELGEAPADPHFRYHSVARSPSDPNATNYLDPSYGVAYSLVGLQAKVTEVTGGTPTFVHALRIRVNSFPTVEVITSYVCPH
jgi:hypothetical protein